MIPVAPLQQIHRAAHCAIDCVGQGFFKSAPHACCKVAPFVSFTARLLMVALSDLWLSHAVARRVWQIGFRQAEVLAEALLQFYDFRPK